MGLIADDRVNRISIPKIFKLIARYIKQEDHDTVLTFLITRACLDQHVDTTKEASAAVLEFIKIQGPTHQNSILAILESFLKDNDSSIEVKNQAVIFLAALAPHLHDTSAKKLQATIEKLFELSINIKSEMLRQSICKCIPQYTRYLPDKSKVYTRD